MTSNTTFQPRPRPRFVPLKWKGTNHGAHASAGCLTLGLWIPVWICLWLARLMVNLMLVTGWAAIVLGQWIWWQLSNAWQANRNRDSGGS